MGADGLLNYAQNTYGVSMSSDQARGFRKRFFDYYWGIGAWHERVQRSRALETRTIGKRRRVWNEQAPLTELLNTPVQGTAADIIKKALILIHNRLPGTGSRLFACVHDEIILEAPKEYAVHASKILRDSLVESGAYYL
jgi:DNA polymerase-1